MHDTLSRIAAPLLQCTPQVIPDAVHRLLQPQVTLNALILSTALIGRSGA